MSEQPWQTPAELARQLRQHLESLRAAGVDWLPNAPLPPPAAFAKPAGPAPEASPAFQPALFAAEPVAGAPAGDVETRARELTVLAGRVSDCQRCPHLAATRTQTVFGVGPLDPELCLVGEAPGRQEDEQGIPFIGDAGQLLTRIIAACGLRREDVYICNIIKCRPPGNRQPTPEEAGNCREYLERQIELVRPKFICALGGTAATNLLGTAAPIGRLRGRFYEYRGVPVMCTFHPSYLLRTPERKKDVWEDMKRLLARMGRPVPGK
jgi:DNA polymerase